MAKDVYSDTVIFPECINILREQTKPIHYKDLTNLAVGRLPKRTINISRQAEDVRERLLSFGKQGTFYIGEPLYVGCLQRWFKEAQDGIQGTLFPDDIHQLKIDITSDAAIDAGVEAIFRDPHMVNNFPKRNPEQVRRSRVKGLLIEKVIANYFKSEYPGVYFEPDNYKKYDTWCSHDFKLKSNGKTWMVDISGRNFYDEHANNHGKKGVDLHILCSLENTALRAEGIITGEKFNNKHLKGGYMHNNLIPMDRFMCYLNISKHYPEIGYEFFTKKAAEFRKSKNNGYRKPGRIGSRNNIRTNRASAAVTSATISQAA